MESDKPSCTSSSRVEALYSGTCINRYSDILAVPSGVSTLRVLLEKAHHVSSPHNISLLSLAMARSWNGMTWDNEWRYLRWHRDISKLAPFSIGRGTSTHIRNRIRICTSIYHWSNHRPKYESRGKRYLAGWSLEICWDRRNPTVLRILITLSYGLWPPLSRCISINSGYMPSSPSIDLFEQEGWIWILAASWDWAMHVCTAICLHLDRCLHAGFWLFTGLLCRSHDSTGFVICAK